MLFFGFILPAFALWITRDVKDHILGARIVLFAWMALQLFALCTQ